MLTFGDDPFDPQTQLGDASRMTPCAGCEQALGRPSTGGPTLLVQHYALFPEHSGPGYRHTYANDAAIRAVLEEASGGGAGAGPGRLLALSGHNHRGSPLTAHRGVSYLTGRALCEHPFPYYLLHTQGPQVCGWRSAPSPRRATA